MFQKLKTKAAVIAAPLLALAASANAALPTEVTAKITEVGSDMVVAAGAIIVAMLGGWGLKKIGTKFGWF